jgi:hypothetical protein
MTTGRPRALRTTAAAVIPLAAVAFAPFGVPKAAAAPQVVLGSSMGGYSAG